MLTPAHADALQLFQNIRTPAALVAAAALSLGFARPFPEATDDGMEGNATLVSVLKRVNTWVAFVSLAAELLVIIFSTNAINRLVMGPSAGSSWGSFKTCSEIISNFPFLNYWISVYIQFILGCIGILVMASIRAAYLVGPGSAAPLLLVSVSAVLRMVGAVNRSTVCRDFGEGSLVLLILSHARRVLATALERRYLTDLAAYAVAFSAVLLGLWNALRALTTDVATVSSSSSSGTQQQSAMGNETILRGNDGAVARQT